MSQQGQGSLRRGPPLRATEQDRLLRAIDELRALERERRGATVASHFQELARRVEAKAREVFRIAGEGDEAASDPPKGRRTTRD